MGFGEIFIIVKIRDLARSMHYERAALLSEYAAGMWDKNQKRR